MPDQDHQPNWNVSRYTPRYNPWLIALVVTMATFMEVLDTSIANVALPHIAGSLGASQDEATWVLTSYLVASAIILPISGWLSTRFGRKRFYMTCVAMFTVCSLLCGLAPTLPLLIFARMLQGLGGGGLAPANRRFWRIRFRSKARAGVCGVWHGRGCGAGHWSYAGRMDHRQLQLALDLLHQYTGRAVFALAEFTHGRGSAVAASVARASVRQEVDFIGLGLVALAWAAGVRARQGPGEGLVRLAGDHHVRYCGCGGAGDVCLLGVEASRSDCGPEAAEEPQLRDRGVSAVDSGDGAVWLHRADSAIPAGPAGLYGGARRHGALSRGLCDDVHDVRLPGKLVGKMDPRLLVCHWLRHHRRRTL